MIGNGRKRALRVISSEAVTVWKSETDFGSRSWNFPAVVLVPADIDHYSTRLAAGWLGMGEDNERRQTPLEGYLPMATIKMSHILEWAIKNTNTCIRCQRESTYVL